MILTTQSALELRYRDFIADKEAVIANMNREITEHGQWSCDWNSALDSINKEISQLLKP